MALIDWVIALSGTHVGLLILFISIINLIIVYLVFIRKIQHQQTESIRPADSLSAEMKNQAIAYKSGFDQLNSKLELQQREFKNIMDQCTNTMRIILEQMIK